MALMFDRQSVIDTVRQPPPKELPDYMLIRLLRLIFYRKRITLEEFSRLYQQYGQRLNWRQDEIRVDNNNDRRALASPTRLTIFLFTRILLNVIRLDIEDFEIVARDTVTGERVTFGSNERVV
jgi:hypothetical protein